MGRKSQGETQFTKATYDHKRPRYDPPSPARLERELEDSKREGAKSRALDQQVNRIGLGATVRQHLGLAEPPKPAPLLRRPLR